MKKVMLGDRLFGRAKKMEFVVFDCTSRENELRGKNWGVNLRKAYERGKTLFIQYCKFGFVFLDASFEDKAIPKAFFIKE